MKVAIIGGGFTGLSAGLSLAEAGWKVTLFETEKHLGGLAVGLTQPNWDWSVEKFYHHIFTNDDTIINLSKKLGVDPIFIKPTTAVYGTEGSEGLGGHAKIYNFDSAKDLLMFPGLSLVDKIRMGAVLAGLKAIPNGQLLEKWTAEKTLTLLMGKTGFNLIWASLLAGKFHDFKSQVNMAWFWARIKKRTPRLGTFPGGFQALADRMGEEIIRQGGKILLGKAGKVKELTKEYDAVLSTIPEANAGVSYLDSHVLFLELKKSLMPGVYWLNILDRKFPFLVVCEHTNFVSAKHFGGKHLVYVGNYLPRDHRLFSLSIVETINEFFPWLKKINSGLTKDDIISAKVFTGKFAQPVMTINYSRKIPPIKRAGNLFVANQAMIYPWDRGTNYAVELGQKAAKEIMESLK